MATFRVGVGSFNIQDGAVGFGTDTDGLGNLKVKGVTKTTDIKVSGASTLTRYSGFAADNINQLENITLTSEVGTIGDIVVGVGTSVIISSASTVTVGTVESVSIGTHFSPPKGGIEERGQDFVEGMMRFNTDLNTMEFYNGDEWRQFTYVSDIQNSPGSAGRAVLFRGSDTNMEFFNIMTLGNTENFGSMIEAHQIAAASGSKTRGIIAGGYSAPDSNYSQPRIEYITLASKGDGITFGELSASHFRNSGGCSSSTRGLFFGGGHPSYYNTIEYVELNTLGNAIDFGDQIKSLAWRRCLSSPTRGFSRGGFPSLQTFLDVVTIANKGNSIKFGDLTHECFAQAACANSVRGIWAGGYQPVSGTSFNNQKLIQYITMASDGDAIVFGDLTTGSDSPAGVANQVRAVISGGYVTPTNINRMEFITIATTGNAQDFGDLGLGDDGRASGTTDAHGGLGGY
jgi:hypothetical protein